MDPPSISSTQTTDYYEVLRKAETFTVPLPTVYLYSNENSAQRYGFGSKLAKERYPRLAEASTRVTVGPMPPEDFLKNFLPIPDAALRTMPRSRDAFRGIKASNKESDIYQALLWALNADTSNEIRWLRHDARCPGFVFCDTSEHPDESGGSVGSVKPDIICYPEQYLPFVEVTKPTARPWEAMANMSFAATFIEVKGKRSDDLYHDPSDHDPARGEYEFVLGSHHPLESAYTKLKEYLGQNVAYATECLSRQHRRFVFSVFVSGNRARLIRWDRAGVIVTKAINFVDNPQLLCEFFWRFAHLSDEERGYDMSVEPASEEEETLFKDAIIAHIRTQIDCSDSEVLARCLDTHYMPGFVSVVHLPHHDAHSQSSSPRRLLVSRPVNSPLSFSGRSTRVYWAVDPNPGTNRKRASKVVLLKDTWRLKGRGAEIEGNVLRMLREAKVRNIPSVLCDGDVLIKGTGELNTSVVDRTITHEYMNPQYTWVAHQRLVRADVLKRVHYRLVLNIAGFDLLSLSGTRELLCSTYDVLKALIDACTLGNRLHRDVHPGNIILYRDSSSKDPPVSRTGYLIDWDLSCTIDGLQNIKDVYRPSFQWQFVAARHLDLTLSKPQHSILDDMESIFWVVVYCGITRLPFTRPVKADDFVSVMDALFDFSTPHRTNNRSGGGGKEKNIADQRHTNQFVWVCSDFKRWIDALCQMLCKNSQAPDDATADGLRWSPESLDKYWQDFLDTSKDSLPLRDSTDNIKKFGDALSSHVADSLKDMAKQATTSVYSGLDKRSYPNSPENARSGKDIPYASSPAASGAEAGPSRLTPGIWRHHRSSSSRSLRSHESSVAPPPSTPTALTARDDGRRPGSAPSTAPSKSGTQPPRPATLNRKRPASASSGASAHSASTGNPRSEARRKRPKARDESPTPGPSNRDQRRAIRTRKRK
ncbi:hypothetical protein C8Q73DRAFT_793572 [Cubamyces lactineus]|nr:hypothetical protein C8Q73DRAFT_793572 [Cubamyces lactineus]